MQAILITRLDEIINHLGYEFFSQLTYPGIYRGAMRNVSPVLIEHAGKFTVVISEADSDACKVLDEDIAVKVYGRYFDWHKDLTQPALSFAAAIYDVIGNNSLVVDDNVPVSRYLALSGERDVELFSREVMAGRYIYHKSQQEIMAQWRSTRNADAALLRNYCLTLRDGPALVDWLARSDVGFAPLAQLCLSNNLSAIYISAPHEVEMFTGLPASCIGQYGITALYSPQHDDITLFSEQPLVRADFRPAGRADSLAAALLAQNLASIGYQADDLCVRDYLDCTAAGLALQDAAWVLRKWQDRRAGDDTAYFVFAANAVLAGFNAAQAFFWRNTTGDITERDLVAVFQQAVNRFASQLGFTGRVFPYFSIVHSGARTLLPATAGDYRVTAADKTIKFDMGLRATDVFGCTRGCSDIARTICTDPQQAAIHHRLRNLLIDQLTPAIRPGMSGEQIHQVGVDCLRPLEAELHGLNLLPAGKSVDDYRRDCGHTLQRQTISSVYFLPGVSETVEVGMLGCVEYVWPINDVLIAVEDGYLITAEKTLSFTAEGMLP